MEILTFTLLVSLLLAGVFALFFVWLVRLGTHEHEARLALLPLEDDLFPNDSQKSKAQEKERLTHEPSQGLKANGRCHREPSLDDRPPIEE